MQHIHIKMIPMLVACEHVDGRIRLILRQHTAKVIPLHPVSIKPVKNQHLLIHLDQKTTVMNKNNLHNSPRFSAMSEVLPCKSNDFYFMRPMIAFAR